MQNSLYASFSLLEMRKSILQFFFIFFLCLLALFRKYVGAWDWEGVFPHPIRSHQVLGQ